MRNSHEVKACVTVAWLGDQSPWNKEVLRKERFLKKKARETGKRLGCPITLKKVVSDTKEKTGERATFAGLEKVVDQT